MEKNTSEKYVGFITGYTDAIIKEKLDVLKMYVYDIRESCINLGIKSSEYKDLEMKGVDDVGPWDAFGHSIIKKINFNQFEKRNEYLKQVAYSYLKMAQVTDSATLKKTAMDLGELVLEDKILKS